MSNLRKSIRKANKAKGNQTAIIVVLFLLFLSSWAFIGGTGDRMAAFEDQNTKWTGMVSLGGFVVDGQFYGTESSLPTTSTTSTWNDDTISVDIDGLFRMHGKAAPFGAEINEDLPYPELYNNLDQYPTAQPKTTWNIIGNILHVDVDGNYLQSGIPSIVAQENGLLVEIYYYTFGLELKLDVTKSVEHDFYWTEFNSKGMGSRYMYDVSPIRGLYALPEVALTPNNESITDMGSDLATYGETIFKFYEPGTETEIPMSTVRTALADEAGFNRDFFMAGGDSGAGLNLYTVVNEDTNQFSVGFVKVGVPGYHTGTVYDMEYAHTVQTTVWDVKLVIPLRLSVIVAYDTPYAAPLDIYNYGNTTLPEDPPDTGSIEYWLEEGEVAWDDALLTGSEEFGISVEMMGIAVVVVLFVLVVLIQRR